MHLTLGLALAVSSALSGSSLQTAAQISVMPEVQTVEEYVRDYFTDTPVLTEIAKCESQFKHFDKNGKLLKNPNSSAIGAFQIMSSLHYKQAEKLGLDINTLQGNLAYAKYLYDKEGTRPWNASKACWGKKVAGSELAVAKK